MTKPIPILETDRLILRCPSAEDFPAWAQFCGDEETQRYIGGVQSPPVAWRSLCSTTGAWLIRGFSMFSVIEKDTGRWIGRVGPLQPEGWPGTEVGWGLIRDVWGRGYATEAAQVCLDYAFEVLGWDEAIHTIDSGNAASQSVARRLGSAILRRALLPAPFETHEVDVWGQTRADWLARRQV